MADQNVENDKADRRKIRIVDITDSIRKHIQGIVCLSEEGYRDPEMINMIELLTISFVSNVMGVELETMHLRTLTERLAADLSAAQESILGLQGELERQKEITATVQANFEGADAQLKEVQGEVADLKKKLADANDVITEITERNFECLDGLVAIQDAIATLDKKPTKGKKPLAKHLFRFYKTARKVSEKLLSGGENKKSDNEGGVKS